MNHFPSPMTASMVSLGLLAPQYPTSQMNIISNNHNKLFTLVGCLCPTTESRKQDSDGQVAYPSCSEATVSVRTLCPKGDVDIFEVTLPPIATASMYSEIQRERADIEGLMARPEYREWNSELIKPKKLLNPVKASRSHQELHCELLMNHKR